MELQNYYIYHLSVIRNATACFTGIGAASNASSMSENHKQYISELLLFRKQQQII